MRVDVVPHDPAWGLQFAALRDDLAAALATVPVVAIEHVGSTSVPGLAAKPILDVDVVVEREHLTPAIDALVRAGYTHEGDKGVPDRHFMRPLDSDPARHVYVCVTGALSLRNHLAVRDVLRADPVLRDAYSAVKLQLAERDLDSIEDYIAGKSEVIQQILTAAGITADDRGDILEVNRPHGR